VFDFGLLFFIILSHIWENLLQWFDWGKSANSLFDYFIVFPLQRLEECLNFVAIVFGSLDF